MASPTTYNRTPIPANLADKVQCPCCLRFHRAKKNGRLVRHGWKETGRRAGEYGQGFQWGNCHGWSKRPLEQTDADALIIIDRLQESIDRATAEIKEHERGRDSYTYVCIKKVYSFHRDQNRALAAHLESIYVSCEITNDKIREQGARVYYAPALRYTFIVLRGFESVEITEADIMQHGASYSKLISVPSWDQLRQKALSDLRFYINTARRQQQAIKDAIESHRANPSLWHLAATSDALDLPS